MMTLKLRVIVAIWVFLAAATFYTLRAEQLSTQSCGGFQQAHLLQKIAMVAQLAPVKGCAIAADGTCANPGASCMTPSGDEGKCQTLFPSTCACVEKKKKKK
jgi:hypothetical protein